MNEDNNPAPGRRKDGGISVGGSFLRPGEESGRPIVGLKRPRKQYTGVILVLALLLIALAVFYHLELLPFAQVMGGHGELVDDEKAPVNFENPESREEEARLALLQKALSARGLYVTMDAFGTPSSFSDIITFVRENPGLNCFVIDVKDNHGRIPFRAEGIPSKPASYNHFSGLVNVLEQEGYYLIARIVAFQDPFMAQAEPQQAIRNADGSLWKDVDGRLWLNPYDIKNWEFVKDICLWALDMGFHEVQLDYVRFPDSAQGLETRGVLMPGHEDFESRGNAVAAFLEYMREALDEKAYLSADVFGFVTIAQDDMGIGQRLEQLAASVDFISPMVYPSHYYNAGIYGFDVPEQHPYEVVYKAMGEALRRTQGLKGKIRPWLQDFSMRFHYGTKEVQSQIDAVFEHDIETYMLWNPANIYTKDVDYSPAF